MVTNMHAGRDTGSGFNHIFSRMRGGPEPTVGMGATRLGWTDRTACTIVEVRLDRNFVPCWIAVQEDTAIRIDNNGMSESQVYRYEPRPDGLPYFYKCTKDGGWRKCYRNDKGRWVWDGTEMLLVGERRHYHDFSF